MKLIFISLDVSWFVVSEITTLGRIFFFLNANIEQRNSTIYLHIQKKKKTSTNLNLNIN